MHAASVPWALACAVSVSMNLSIHIHMSVIAPRRSSSSAQLFLNHISHPIPIAHPLPTAFHLHISHSSNGMDKTSSRGKSHRQRDRQIPCDWHNRMMCYYRTRLSRVLSCYLPRTFAAEYCFIRCNAVGLGGGGCLSVGYLCNFHRRRQGRVCTLHSHYDCRRGLLPGILIKSIVGIW